MHTKDLRMRSPTVDAALPRRALDSHCKHGHLLIENHGLLIQMCTAPSLKSTPRFIPSVSPVMSRLTFSFTCQLICVITTTLIIHHSFTPGSKPTFSINPSHLNTSSTLDCFHDHGTGPDLSCFSIYF